MDHFPGGVLHDVFSSVCPAWLLQNFSQNLPPCSSPAKPYWLLVAASMMSFHFTADLLSAWNSADGMPSEGKQSVGTGELQIPDCSCQVVRLLKV